MLFRSRILSLSVIALSLAACSRPAPSTETSAAPTSEAAATQSGLQVQAPWIRTVPPGASAAAGYAVLRNDSDKAMHITQISSEVAQHAMLHSMSMEGGVMQMRMLDSLEVPAHGSATLAPGGMHLMLMGLKQALSAGQTVEIHLKLDSGETLSVKFPVRDEAP